MKLVRSNNQAINILCTLLSDLDLVLEGYSVAATLRVWPVTVNMTVSAGDTTGGVPGGVGGAAAAEPRKVQRLHGDARRKGRG